MPLEWATELATRTPVRASGLGPAVPLKMQPLRRSPQLVR